MEDITVTGIPLTLLEYIVLPLIAIMAAFSLKKRAKKNLMSIEEFLEDLNIDIKVICALGLILFALSHMHHRDNDITLNFAWIGVVGALLCYIYIHQFYQFRYDGFSSRKTIFFGMRNAVYKDSSWFVFLLVFYVLVGMVLEEILDKQQKNGFSACYSLKANMYYLACILLSYLCLNLFFFLLNQQTKVYLLGSKAYVRTFSNAFVNEPGDVRNAEAIKKYKLVLATVKRNDPILISVYERLSEIYEKLGDITVAANYLDEIIKLLSDSNVNKDEAYLIDAYLTKVDFYKRNQLVDKAEALIAEIKQKFPGSDRFA